VLHALLTECSVSNTARRLNQSQPAISTALRRLRDILEREGLVENARKVGGYLLERLRKAFGASPIVGEIRGLGMLAALEIVRDRQSREPFPNVADPAWIAHRAFDRGLIVRALLQYYAYYGDEFMVECPTGSGRMMTLYQVAEELSKRLASIFLQDERGRRPVNGGVEKFQTDPHFKDYVWFYEYFHGDNGAGLGASHQTGWTGIVARAMHLFATNTPEQVLELGKKAAVVEITAPRRARNAGPSAAATG